jgi:hypothetical protein
MSTAFDAAVSTLYQAPYESFVAMRKQLALERKDAGDKEGATRLLKLPRPPITAWAVNQLYWRARPEFDELFASAALVRQGDLEATGRHRAALSALRTRAATLLREAGNAASETTLQRVTTTLSALAVVGSFAPDPPGALRSDREPPGFEGALAQEQSKAARREAEANRERRRLEQEQAKKQVERQRIAAALRHARSELTTSERDVERHKRALGEAEQRLDRLRTAVAELERQLSDLERSG